MRVDVSEVKEAENGEEAIRIFESFKPDLVFMDIVMPVLSGIEATKKIRAIDPKTPIIGLSTLDHGDVIDKLLLAGANTFIKKPFSLDELTEAMRKIFEGSL